MSFAAIFTLAITLATLVALVIELAAPEVVLFAALTVLMIAGVLTPAEAVAGFGSVTLLTIAALFVVAGAVNSSGVLGYVADRLLGRNNRHEPLIRLMVPAALLSAFLNNVPVVAMFTPAVIGWCKRHDFASSRMLMPLSFATILGGMCTLVGTSTTLVVDGLMRDAGMAGLGMFEIAWVGVPVACAGILVIWLIARRVLPDRRDPVRELTDKQREFLVEMLVDEKSPLAGKSIAAAGLRNLPGLYLVNIERDGEFFGSVKPEEKLRAHDRLVFAGVASSVVELRRVFGLTPAPEAHYDPLAEQRRDRLFEAVVSPSSPLVGTTLKDIGFRSRYDAAVIAVHRAGHRLPTKIGEVTLRVGDTLMVEAEQDFFARWANSLDFALVSRVDSEPRVGRGKAPLALFVLAAIIACVATGLLPMMVAAFCGVGLMLLLGVTTAQGARQSLRLSVLATVAGALGLAHALQNSGAAHEVASVAINVSSALGPTGLLAATVLLAVLMTELVTNVAAAAIVFPIAIAAAVETGLDPRPFAIAVAIACSASFLTPTGYQTNLMIYGPGGYRFTDFLRLGFPITILVVVLTVVIVPWVWPL